MRIHELNTKRSRQPIRKGRGISAGRGKTAGRGTKGQNSRTGGGVRPGFEGGQNPLSARLPKLAGFNSRRQPAQAITTGDLNRVKAKTINNQVLAEAGVVDSPDRPIKVIAGGKLTAAKTVNLQGASPAADKAISRAGGQFIISPAPKPRRAKSKTDKKV